MYNQINYSSNFKKIAEVKIMHDFFKSNRCNSFEIRPSMETQTLFKNYGILFRITKNGFVLISSGDLRYSSNSFSGSFEAKFVMKNNDPIFQNYTNISLEKGNRFLFKNKWGNGLLHESEFVDERTIDGFSDDFFSGIISLTLNAANEFFGEGSEKTNSEPELYSIKFSSREILVRYNFFSTQENFDFSNYYITDEENVLKLDKVEERTLFSGKNVFCIEQAKSITCSQFYEDLYYLKKEDNFLNTFSVRLPSPDPKNIALSKESDKFFAEVFVSIN